MAGGAQPRTRLPVRNPGGPPPHDRYALYNTHARYNRYKRILLSRRVRPCWASSS
jgi:hypothetical protein